MTVQLLAAALAAAGAHADTIPPTTSAEVVVLSTLHQHHDRVPGYGFEELQEIIERLNPDILAVELTAAGVAARTDQRVKQEYPRSVYPLLDRQGYVVVPLEPAEPLFSELAGLNARASSTFSEHSPEAARAFSLYTEALYDHLFELWISPEAVNSATTDALFAVKHAFQDALLPPDQAVAWERWNQHFLDRIVEAAERHPGRRLVVLVGAEHAFWLRARLADHAAVTLLDTPSLLSR